jgi:glycosyltransferase involved in cell wall biosynthesis
MHPLVSIIIPCYNAQDYIADSINSALEQFHPNCEVIVVDDGSSDNSLNIIKSYGRSIRWKTGPNCGGCVARNTGLQMAAGEWIQFHDADDIMSRDCIASKLAIEPQANEVICCDVAFLEAPYKHAFKGEGGYRLPDALQRGGPQTAAPLYQKKHLEAIGGFTPGLLCAQDYDLALRFMIYHKCRFRSNGRIGIIKRKVRGSVSLKSTRDMALALEDVLRRASALLRDTGSLEEPYRRAISVHLANIARQHWQQGMAIDAKRTSDLSQEMWQWGFRDAYTRPFEKYLASLIGFERFETCYLSAKRALFKS